MTPCIWAWYAWSMTTLFPFLILACPTPATVVEVPLLEGEWERPAWDDLEELELPPGPDGEGYVLVETPEVVVWADIDGIEFEEPLTVATGCSASVIACYQPGQRNLSGCLGDTPVCEDGLTPCCPRRCATDYQEALRRLEEPARAFMDTVWGTNSCVEGL